MNDSELSQAIRRLKKALRGLQTPVVSEMGKERDPFKVLVACLLSLRTRDEVTGPAARRLFALADSPKKLKGLPRKKIEEAIYPVAFFRNKAEQLQSIARALLEEHGGEVPNTLNALLKLKGVGRKTANLTLILGHGRLGICVDIHVHRISNRWGYVNTKTPDETEFALRDKMPKKFWNGYNDLLVTFGQNICKPVSPFCSACPLEDLCEKVGVERSR